MRLTLNRQTFSSMQLQHFGKTWTVLLLRCYDITQKCLLYFSTTVVCHKASHRSLVIILMKQKGCEPISHVSQYIKLSMHLFYNQQGKDPKFYCQTMYLVTLQISKAHLEFNKHSRLSFLKSFKAKLLNCIELKHKACIFALKIPLSLATFSPLSHKKN